MVDGRQFVGRAREKVRAKSQAKIAEQMEGFEGLNQLNLTADQQAKIAELRRSTARSSRKSARPRRPSDPGPETSPGQRRHPAKAAKAAGKKPGNVRKAIAAAVNLTAEQQAKMAKLDKAAKELRAEVRTKVLSILTPEQIAQLKKARHHKCQQSKGSQSTATGS